MKAWWILGIVLPLVFFGGIVIISIDWDTTLSNNEGEQKTLNLNDPTKGGDSLEKILEQGNPDAPIGGGGSGGGSQGGGSGGGSNQENQCEGPQISYSLGEFETFEACNEYTGQTCINKLLNCSATVQNFNNIISGNFELEFTYYYMNGSTKITLGSSIETGYVTASNFSKIPSLTTITGSQANEELNCAILTKSVPRICT